MSLLTVSGVLIAVLAALWVTLQGRKPKQESVTTAVHDNPLEAAEASLRFGDVARARAILNKYLISHPEDARAKALLDQALN